MDGIATLNILPFRLIRLLVPRSQCVLPPLMSYRQSVPWALDVGCWTFGVQRHLPALASLITWRAFSSCAILFRKHIPSLGDTAMRRRDLLRIACALASALLLASHAAAFEIYLHTGHAPKDHNRLWDSKSIPELQKGVTGCVRLQQKWQSKGVELGHGFGFSLTFPGTVLLLARRRASVLVFSAGRRARMPSRRPKYTSSGVALPSASW